MARRCGLVGMLLASLACVLLMLTFNQKTRSFNRTIPVYPEPQDYSNFSGYVVPMSQVLKQQRALLRQELRDYPFPNGHKLENYTLSDGGRPIRNIIITTWRSGSTFLGDLINAIPGNYYHYEPLLDYGIMQIRGPPHSGSALNNLKRLLKCDYRPLYDYLEYGKTHVYLFTHNTRLWSVCEMHPYYCWNATFLSEFCKLFPFQSMKVVRLRLKLAEELLEEDE